ncbi:hypothetical protein Aab01nite_30990 [Paractinoplanes abujensis]|uniref:Uncharacterized protein n=1 Tax=Paractinoplanes abujensis TaxID=882441 RepID=A0A7W7D0H2_9ACTN|nr:hypothetical protein [Actinoplanes abujensis]MBB4698007.1 hypothetical protein [Actinoplanes abujensis]GID19509.1 hypothetical protein Aab01nite_30990 [Actinoplanes abujensis]
MTITLPGLLDADTGRLLTIARRWDRLAHDLDTAVEELGRHTRDLPHHWPAGPSSQAAQDKRADIRVQVGTGHVHCVTIAEVIRDYAGSVEYHRRLLLGLVAEAEQRGLRIDLRDGTITAPLDRSADQASYAAQISEILARVNEDDRATAERMPSYTYRDTVIPDTDRPRYDEAAVLALANAGADPGRVSSWWRAQHPLVQDRAIVEHPEIIGAATGLPAKDRDSANRLLLRRDREALLASREAHQNRHDGALTRAQLDIDRRLAALDDLERRARGRRIVTYTPGAEAESELVRR